MNSKNNDKNGNHLTIDKDEGVLDADIRETNRFNVQMAIMKQRNQAVIDGSASLFGRDSEVGKSRFSRSRSLTSAFSQTGVLPAASLVEAEQQRMKILKQQQGLDFSHHFRSLARASIGSDQGSSDSMVTDSYNSSVRQSASLMDQYLATVRICVRRRSFQEIESNGQPDSDHLARGQVKNSIATIADRLTLRAKFATSRSKSSMGSKSIADSGSESSGGPISHSYEIELIEANNLGHQNQSSFRPPNSSIANNSSETPPTPTTRSLGRRDSLMNVLMPSSVTRRQSVDGVFARVFKSQQSVLIQEMQQKQQKQLSTGGGNTLPTMGNQKKFHSPTQSIDFDTHSLASASTSILDLGCGTDYIQSDVNRQQNGRVVFEPNSMRMICHEHEFPLRVSLYQVDKKGARYTLGHCFVSLEDWADDFDREKDRISQSSESSSSEAQSSEAERRDCQSDGQTGLSSSRSSVSDELRRRSSSFGPNEAFAMSDPIQKIRFTIVDRPSPNVRYLDFKLYQTIFDAIK